jgi:hypothetical protein
MPPDSIYDPASHQLTASLCRRQQPWIADHVWTLEEVASPLDANVKPTKRGPYKKNQRRKYRRTTIHAPAAPITRRKAHMKAAGKKIAGKATISPNATGLAEKFKLEHYRNEPHPTTDYAVTRPLAENLSFSETGTALER